MEGDVSVRVTACSPTSPFAAVGLAACDTDTSAPRNISLVFSVADAASPDGAATATRTLVVTATCDEGSDLCDDGTCAARGLCPSAVLKPTVNTPPRMFLPEDSAARVQVPAGTPYHACTAQETDIVCEAGALAEDDEDGVLDHRVLACPPVACLSRGCPGHEFAIKGVACSRSLLVLQGLSRIRCSIMHALLMQVSKAVASPQTQQLLARCSPCRSLFLTATRPPPQLH